MEYFSIKKYKLLIIKLIHIYQFVISPLLGPRCRFYPTCSQYGIQAITQFGILKGCLFTLIRILKCQPFYKNKNINISNKII